MLPSWTPTAQRRAFCAAMGVVYLIAFTSVYVQFPGLFGFDGLEPAEAFLRRLGGTEDAYNTWDGAFALFQKLPTALWFHSYAGVDVDVLADIIALAGMAVATAIACGLGCIALFTIEFLLYLSLYLVGQTFLSFQWDILLLETGFLAILFAPLMPRSPRAAPEPAVLLLRALLFKLMLLAGLVKLQARCPSWETLTALDYHYATQCIPNLGAWFAHQLPPVVQQASVAAALIIEIPSTLFIIAPVPALRLVAAALQALLQLLIIATGNYNFFNLLVLVLCALLVPVRRPASSPAPDLDADGPLLWLWKHAAHPAPTSSATTPAWFLFAFLFHAASAYFMVAFTLRPQLDDQDSWLLRSQLSLALDWTDMQRIVDDWLAPIALFLAASMAAACVAYAHRTVATVTSQHGAVATALTRLARFVWAVVVVSACCSMLLVGLVPLGTVSRRFAGQLPNVALQSYSATRMWHISSGYGLFRSMTGMGPDATDARGRRVSVVARPEIIVEVQMPGSQRWHELDFRYKPGALDGVLPFVAPHQPRLDWQMWFAALASYQSAPWFVHFADKLMQGSGAVIDLLPLRSPLRHQNTTNGDVTYLAAARVRATLFHYDLTRWNTTWARQLPFPGIINVDNSTLVWHRRNPTPYLPAISPGDPSVLRFLQHHGWSRVSPAARSRRRIRDRQCGGDAACAVVAFCRKHQTWATAAPLSLLLALACRRLLTCNRT